jgi:hypothetical protein
VLFVAILPYESVLSTSFDRKIEDTKIEMRPLFSVYSCPVYSAWAATVASTKRRIAGEESNDWVATKNTKRHKNYQSQFLCLFVLFVAILPYESVLSTSFDRKMSLIFLSIPARFIPPGQEPWLAPKRLTNKRR